MKAGFALVLMSASALALGSAAVRAEEALEMEALVAQSDTTQAETVAYIPLPPSRPIVAAQAPAPRRIRVAQASIAPAPRPVAVAPIAVARKPSQIWLSMGYGF